MNVPFLDLAAHHAPIIEEVQAAIAEVIASGAFAGGPYVTKFERDFATYCGTEQAIGVGNGTDALWFALLACGVGPGDEVITVPSTFIATAEAITYCGATPVLVDIEDSTYTMDATQLEAAITSRTKAVLPVHLFGHPANLSQIGSVARRHGLRVIEDACQAHGAEYLGTRTGGLGDAGCFSFYPGKNLGAFGEAGAVTTNNPRLAERIRILRDHGQSQKNRHEVIGWNGRMDGIQAAVLQIKLKRLSEANSLRRQHAAHYDSSLRQAAQVTIPKVAAHCTHAYHLYVVRVPERDRILKEMAEAGIACGVHYPVPIHLQPAYAHLGHGPGSFPVAERLSAEFLSLPMFPELSAAQIDYVCGRLSDLVARQSVLC